MLHRICRYVAAMVLVANWATAQGDDDIAALEAAREGREAFDRGDFEIAAEQLGRAHALVPTPTVALYRARALARLGRLAEAAEMYEAATIIDPYAQPSEAHREAQQQAFSELAALKPRVPRLRVEIQGGATLANVELNIDGAVVTSGKEPGEYLVNPGTHTVVARHGEREVSRAIELREKGSETLRFWFEPDAPPPVITPPPPLARDAGPHSAVEPLDQGVTTRRSNAARTAGWVALGLGSTGLTVGAVSAAVSAKKASALDAEGCQDNRCYSDQADDVRVHNTTLVLSNVSLIAGGVAAATGVALLLASPADKERPRPVAAWIGPGSLAVKGRF